MLARISRRVCVLGLVLAMGACAELDQRMDALEVAVQGPFAEHPLALKVAGANVNDDLRDRQKLNGLLNRLEAPSKTTPKGRIDAYLASNRRTLKGLGGIQSRTSAKVAAVALDKSGRFAGPLTTYEVIGKIQRDVNGETGFHFIPGQPMHIWVEVITTATRTQGPDPASLSRAEMFRVEVPAGAMRVEQRSSDTGDIFPIFGAAAFKLGETPENMDFAYKLWAVGTHVRVTDYWLDENYVSGSPNYITFSAANPPALTDPIRPKYDEIASIFEADEDACFDMMFKLNPGLEVSQGGALVGGNLPSTASPPYYCLGRCKNPPIVNTR